ncbi:MAG: flagellar hook-length control protein FliK [Acetatifactor sp.]|nr:flagellar hook-length control protein FliK [Acetatifactor sp.]
MKLADLLFNGQVNNTGGQVQQPQSGQSNAQLNQMIRNLAPGQTLQGEVVSNNNGEIQIKLSDDMVLSARLEQGMNLEVGKNVTFEVRNNGKTLTLSPLFANTATEANALKALDMAALPINQSTVTMTGLMMQAGLSVDRNSLQQMFREMNTFPNSNLSNLVDLHKLGLEVNEENLAQIDSYKNLTHQLVDGMHTVLDTLPETLQGMVQEGSVEGAAKMFQELLQLLSELPGDGVPKEEALKTLGEDAQQAGTQTGAGVQAGTLGEEDATGNTVTQLPPNDELEELLGKIANENTKTLMSMADGKGDKKVIAEMPTGAEAERGIVDEKGVAGATRFPLTQELLQFVSTRGGSLAEYGDILRQLATAEQDGDLAGQAKALQQLLQQGRQNGDFTLLEGILAGKTSQNVLSEGLSKLWTIEPREVADAGKVEEFYQRLDRQLKGMTRILEQAGQTESGTFKAATNMSQNVDFLQQLNQAYTYVQLPLRLQHGEAHGDLYVYTNKRNLAAKDGQISALLHLDMEHLGPVDVYVAMQAERVNTKFYVQDDEMLDFLEAHMDLLTSRLQKRGYQCDFSMQVRDAKRSTGSGIQGLMAQEQTGPQSIAQYAFDVRA